MLGHELRRLYGRSLTFLEGFGVTQEVVMKVFHTGRKSSGLTRT